MSNPFVRAPEAYVRDMDVLNHFKVQQAAYLEEMTGKPFDVCMDFVKKQLAPGGEFEIKDPSIIFTERGENGDREQKQGTLLQYLDQAVRRRDLIAPTMTTYLHPKRQPSYLVGYIDGNVKARSVAKKAMFQAERDGDATTTVIKHNEQNNKKTKNNSISGAHVSASTPLYNKTCHSTLTSNCRATSGFGNANNEKFLAGNRHYWTPEITKASIISITRRMNYEQFEKVMTKYGIHYPTTDETMSVIERSSKQYWISPPQIAKIRELVDKLTPIKRAAFVYVGDFYHFAKLNDKQAREFIGSLSARVVGDCPDAETVIKKSGDDVVHLAAQICPDEMRGKDLKKIVGTPEYNVVANTCANILSTIDKYADFIEAMWVTDNMPTSLAYLPDSIRHVALTSDTDSTIFTVQDWVQWYWGDIIFGQRGESVAATMIFLSAQTITHILAMMSANFGIITERIHQIAMKNEFKFDVFVPTQVAKHYFALIGCKEGNLYAKYKKEIKGVHLKSSNAPPYVNEKGEELMLYIMNTVHSCEKISIKKILKEVADVERKILDSIASGAAEFFRRGQIKPAESYVKSADESPFIQYSQWNDVWGVKYGTAPPPPYMTVKVKTTLDTPSKTKEWLDSLEDQELAGRYREWMTRYNKRYIGTIQVPQQLVAASGMPKELIQAMGAREMVADTCKTLYLILETLGVYISNAKTTRLASDHY